MKAMMRCVNRYAKLDHPQQPTLFLEFHGSRRGVEEQAAEVGEIAELHGGGDFRWATRVEEREKLWQARHDALYASLASRPGAKAWSTDVCVPISRLADCIAATREDLDKSFIPAPLVGHVGDGNFHGSLALDPNNPEEVAEAFVPKIDSEAGAPEPTGKHVAVVGSGPAGLAAAYYLRRSGHCVTVYERRTEPGGMLRYGIPQYRMPREILDKEIQRILDLGVELKLNTKIGRDISLDDLRKEVAVLTGELEVASAQILRARSGYQEAKDRLRSQHDYRVNLKAELEIRQLHDKIDHLLYRLGLLVKGGHCWQDLCASLRKPQQVN